MTFAIKSLACTLLAAAAFSLIGCGSQQTASGPGTAKLGELTTAKPATNTQCPVTGESVDPKDSSLESTVYKGQTYVFCCSGCKEAFAKNPDKAIASLDKPAPATK